MIKNTIKIMGFLLVVILTLFACCHKPLPPVSQSELINLRAQVEQSDSRVTV